MIEKFLEYIEKIRNYSNHTVINYKNDIEEFKEFINKENINNFKDVEYTDIRFYLMSLYDKKYSRSTISRKLSSLRSFYKYLEGEGEVGDNPFILVSTPKKEKKLPKFLYTDELNKILELPNLTKPLGQRNRLILELLYATGIRVSELVNIKLEDIDINSKTIDIIGKGNKERYVSFGDYAKEILETYLKDGRLSLLKGKESNYLTLNNNGKNLTTRGVRLILNKIIEDSSLKMHISPHMLRHTFATHMLNNGADLITVQEILGHENLSTTGIYTHVTDAHLQSVYKQFHPRAKKGEKNE